MKRPKKKWAHPDTMARTGLFSCRCGYGGPVLEGRVSRCKEAGCDPAPLRGGTGHAHRGRVFPTVVDKKKAGPPTEAGDPALCYLGSRCTMT